MVGVFFFYLLESLSCVGRLTIRPRLFSLKKPEMFIYSDLSYSFSYHCESPPPATEVPWSNLSPIPPPPLLPPPFKHYQRQGNL